MDPNETGPDGADPAELARALAAHRQAFLAFLERRLGSRELAEDLLQEAFARSIDRLASLRDGESVVAWFYRTLRNAVVDFRRRDATARRALDGFAHELAEPTPETHAAVCQCVARLTATLKPEYAAALQQIEVEGVTVKAFAEVHGISSGNAAVRVFRAREALRRQVLASCGACAAEGCGDCSCESPAAAPSSCHRGPAGAA